MQVQALVVVTDTLALLDETPAKCDQPDRTQGIETGDQLELLDASNATVGVADLEDATGAGPPEPPQGACVWMATFPEHPSGGEFYKARLGEWTSEAVAEDDLATQRLVIQPGQ